MKQQKYYYKHLNSCQPKTKNIITFALINPTKNLDSYLLLNNKHPYNLSFHFHPRTLVVIWFETGKDI